MAAPQCVGSMDSKGMQFAKQQLEKFGWKEGIGLGRHNSGITAALKPKLKFDAAGLGHKQSEELVYEWWNHAYNKAAQSFDVKTTENGPTVIQKGSIGKISKRKQVTADSSHLHSYGSFHKAGTLTSGHLEEEERSTPVVIEEKEYFVKLSDEELFKRCGGRTAHKGARHGHRCKGKLARVAEQEALMLAAMNQTEVQEKKEPEVEGKKKKSSKGENKTDSSKENEEESAKSEKSKKKKKDKSNLSEDAVQPAVDVTETNVCSDVQEKKKKKKRKHEECDTVLHVSEEQNDAKEKTKKKKKKKENLEVTLETNSDDVSPTNDVVDVHEISEKKKKKKKKKETATIEPTEADVINNDNSETTLADVKRRKKHKKGREE